MKGVLNKDARVNLKGQYKETLATLTTITHEIEHKCPALNHR